MDFLVMYVYIQVYIFVVISCPLAVTFQCPVIISNLAG